MIPEDASSCLIRSACEKCACLRCAVKSSSILSAPGCIVCNLILSQTKLNGFQGSGLGGMLGTPMGGATGGATGDPGSGLSALLSNMGGMGGLGAFGNMGTQPVSDPETAYASQLQQLQVYNGAFRKQILFLSWNLDHTNISK